ncbi:hypothetical protein DFH27DRAFT_576787 [Peziza echinospora]|nr:hypothetical protein DFH27DRAFT_576787 [Peziza echinospora]
MYEPDINPADLNTRWDTILLSTRDLSQDIPINFEETTGVVVSTACFSDGVYTLNKFTCLANLLAFGYRRLVVDLFWLTADDAGDGMWHFCPSSDPLESGGVVTTTTTTTTNQNTSPTAAAAAAFLKSRATSGKYKCDKHLDATALFAFLSDWVSRTEYNLLASVATVVFNLHNDQSRPVTQGPQSVNAPAKLSSISGFPNSLIYTPHQLHQDRVNLNSSWLNGGNAGDDEARYFNVVRRSDGGLSSVDAWPSGSFLAFDVHHRLLLAFGDVRVAGFDPAADSRLIFQPEEIGWPPETHDDGKERCYFDANITDLKNANTSWAELIDSDFKSFSKEKVLEATDCGYSILVNTTLDKDEDYFSLMEATVWSWAKGEPASSPPTGGGGGSGGPFEDDMFRCAAMATNDAARWSVVDCNQRLYPACRVNDLPYKWTLGTRITRYFEAPYLCPPHSAFDVPRTALENRHLRAAAKSAGLGDGDKVWLDYQSLAVPECWVTGGENAQCPYKASDIGNKTIIVPTVAAIILLIVAGLMAFAKLGNRRIEKARKKRRKMVRRAGEYEYEGVPT